MRNNLGVKTYIYPEPVLIIATYDEDNNVDVMNAAWGGICGEDTISICIDASHKTTSNLKKNKALSAGKQSQQLPSGQTKVKNLRNDPNIVVDLEALESARKARTEEIYNGLSEEQKAELSELSVKSINTTELQNKYGVSYNEAYDLVEAYGKKPNQNQPQPNKPEAKKQDSGDTLTL